MPNHRVPESGRVRRLKTFAMRIARPRERGTVEDVLIMRRRYIRAENVTGRSTGLDTPLFARGFGLGFVIAAAIGPIGLLCIRRTLVDGALVGFVSGLGAATADAFYGALAAFGLTALTGLLISLRVPLGLAGGAFLIWLGLRTMRTRSPVAAEARARPGLAGAYLSTVALTLTNPATILSFGAVFVGLGVFGGGFTGALSLVVGVGLGSAAWWAVLAVAVSTLRRRISPGVIAGINVASGALLIAFGFVAVASALTALR
jgi:threonine/homoserine/homoserine lactone efflux protein